MATAVEQGQKPGPVDDDEEWLYGDTGKEGGKEPAAPGTGAVEELPPLTIKQEAGDVDGGEPTPPGETYDDDDSDDEDDVQVTIGDIKAFPMNDASRPFKSTAAYQKQTVAPVVGQKITTTTGPTKGVNPDLEGMVNGVSVYEFNLESLQDDEKPWRKPGADITDYFNYGFTEDSWKKYCHKQNRLRGDNGLSAPKPFVHRSDNIAPVGMMGHQSSLRVLTSKPMHSMRPGTIDVIGSTSASRRPVDEHVQMIGTLGGADVKPMLEVGMPPMEMPPQDMAPHPDYSMPPPGITIQPLPPPPFQNVPPPGMPVPPPIMYAPPPSAPPPFFPPHVAPIPPDPRFADRPAYVHEANPNPGFPDTQRPNWDARDGAYRDREFYKRERSPGSPAYDSGEGGDFRYRTERRDNYRDRGYYRETRQERSRSRSRSREKDRRHRDRDDKHKSKRKIKQEPDDSDYYKSSKHKKSKRSKRDKDTDYDPASPSRDDKVSGT